MTKETAVATESEASGAIDALPPEVETIRVTYSDLHGIQRGKDVPRTRVRAGGDGRPRVLLGRHGHRSSPRAGRRRRVRLPGHDRVRGPLHASPASLGARRRRLPVRPGPRRGARADRPARLGPPGRGGPWRARPDRQGGAGAGVLPLHARRGRPLAAPRRQPQHGLHGGASGGPDRHREVDAERVRAARPWRRSPRTTSS